MSAIAVLFGDVIISISFSPHGSIAIKTQVFEQLVDWPNGTFLAVK